MLTEELKISNYSKFKHYLTSLIGDNYDVLVEKLGGEDAVMNASFCMSTDSNCAYDGSLIENILEIAKNAVKINELFPENLRCQNSNIYKVILLMHLAKIVMYEKNDDEWEIKKRGLVYKFKDNGVTLKCGAYSALLAMNSGVNLTEEEFDAMLILDREKEGKSNVVYNTLPLIIKQANEIMSVINKKK